jgi:sterol desaturase/sphingolipid hydroxylase (fatty acid hydroxylase superfamily)
MNNKSIFQQLSDTSSAVYCTSVFLVVFTGITAFAALVQAHPVLFFSILFFNGFLCATYVEYYVHRFYTHNKKNESNALAFQRHKNHHRHPGDIRVTLLERIIMGVIFMAFLSLAIYLNNYFTLVTGFIFGCAYSFICHWMLHQRWVKYLFPRLLQFHIYHHSKFPNKCFGFSVPWWDIVFDTAPPREAPVSGKVVDLYFSKDRLVIIEQPEG